MLQSDGVDPGTYIGEAAVVRPGGRLSWFDELRLRASAGTHSSNAFDLIERNGEDLRRRPFLERKDALARLRR